MKNYLLILPLAVLLACNSGARQEDRKDSARAGTEENASRHEDFITRMVLANQHMIQLGRLAGVRAEQQRIRNLGDTLARTYQAANSTLEQLATQHHVTLPADSLEASKAVITLTAIRDPRNFERTWLKEVIAAQKEMSYRYKQAEASKDAGISSLAKEMATFTERQLDEASNILEDMRKLINKTDRGADV